MTFTRKLRAYTIRGMLTNISFSFCYLETQIFKFSKLQNCDFTCFVWVWNLVSDVKARTYRILVFWVMMQCSLLNVYQVFGGTFRHHILLERLRWQVPSRRLHDIITQRSTILIELGRLRTGEYLDLRGGKRQETRENCVMRSCMVCTLHPVLLGWSRRGGWDGRGMWRAWGRSEIRTKLWSENLKGTEYFEDVGLNESIILKCTLNK
jgi:hypothetical protein